MGLSKYPSKVNLPLHNPGCVTVLDFLIRKFPAISAEVWLQRVVDEKVHWLDGALIRVDTEYKAQQCVCYYREVEQEPVIPFQEKILYQDDHILLVCKPHFLPVTPGGIYVDECLQNRLRRKTGINDLQALHRLDRETAGLVLFSVNRETRARYHALFAEQRIQKKYHAIAQLDEYSNVIGKQWVVKNRLEKSNPKFTMKIVPCSEKAPVNAHSIIRCISQKGSRALFELSPVTGKTHQLRVHMQSIGWPILNDRFYPNLQPKTADDFSKPLQLLARELTFIDPVTKTTRQFESDKILEL